MRIDQSEFDYIRGSWLGTLLSPSRQPSIVEQLATHLFTSGHTRGLRFILLALYQGGIFLFA